MTMTTTRQATRNANTSIDLSSGSQNSCRYLPACTFCKIAIGEIPSIKLYETDLSYAFLALPPLSEGHALVIPKDHAVKMHELPDEYLADALAVAKRIALQRGLENYNIIQNNGRVAYQSVDHVHFHVITKPGENTGLVVKWPPQKSPEELDAYRRELYARHGVTGKKTLAWEKIKSIK